jgi:hypothetical protein
MCGTLRSRSWPWARTLSGATARAESGSSGPSASCAGRAGSQSASGRPTVEQHATHTRVRSHASGPSRSSTCEASEARYSAEPASPRAVAASCASSIKHGRPGRGLPLRSSPRSTRARRRRCRQCGRALRAARDVSELPRGAQRRVAAPSDFTSSETPGLMTTTHRSTTDAARGKWSVLVGRALARTGGAQPRGPCGKNAERSRSAAHDELLRYALNCAQSTSALGRRPANSCGSAPWQRPQRRP